MNKKELRFFVLCISYDIINNINYKLIFLKVLLLSTSSLQGYWIHRTLLIAKKSWFDWIDLVLNKENFDLWDEDYIFSLTKEIWIKVLSITAPSKGVDEESINKIISLAEKLGSQLVTFSPPYFKDSNASWFGEYLTKVKKETNLSVAIKNIEPEFLLLIIPKYKKASFIDIKKITWDTALDVGSIDSNSWVDINKAYRTLWTSIKNIYLSDRQQNKYGLLPGQAWGWISYLPLESFLMKLKTSWYRSFISIKVNSDSLWVWNEELVLQNFKNVISYYNKHYKDYK